MNNIFTIDVEECYHADNISRFVSPDRMEALPGRLDGCVRRILDMLGGSDSRATFFILGCLAERYRDLIKDIAQAGHEIASHGYEHRSGTGRDPEDFERDLAKSIEALHHITGRDIKGYRAPNFSILDNHRLFFTLLKKHGIKYDSSFSASFFRRDSYPGVRSIDPETAEGVLEFPVSSFRLGPVTFPLGGGYFRVYPCKLTEWGLRSGPDPAVFYIHPWEIDPGQPRIQAPMHRYMRHYINLRTTERKLNRLLSDMRFVSFEDHLKTVRP